MAPLFEAGFLIDPREIRQFLDANPGAEGAARCNENPNIRVSTYLHVCVGRALSSYTDGDNLPVGTTISVYNTDGQTLLYTEAVTQAIYSAGNEPYVSAAFRWR